MPSLLWCCWLGSKKGIRPVKNWVVGCWRVYLSERGADLHMAQLMPLPLTVSCFSKIQISFTLLVLAHPDSPEQRAVKWVSASVMTSWAGSDKRYLRHNVCLETKIIQNCLVLYCVRWLYTVMCTMIWTLTWAVLSLYVDYSVEHKTLIQSTGSKNGIFVQNFRHFTSQMPFLLYNQTASRNSKHWHQQVNITHWTASFLIH